MYSTSTYIQRIKDISREGKELGIDLGFARDIFVNAVRVGKISEDEDPNVQAILRKTCPDIDWKALQSDYLAMTYEEKYADLQNAGI